MATRPRMKSLSGCGTCKRRRKKCDEVRPICGHCHRLGLECSWRAIDRSVAESFIVRVPRLRRRPDSLRSMDFFHSCTLPQLQRCQPAIPWMQSLGFLLQTEGAFSEILTALVKRQLSSNDVESSYQQALAAWRSSLARYTWKDAPLVLIGCLLFVMIESLRQSTESFLVHLRNAVYLVNAALSKSPAIIQPLGPWLGLLESFCAHTWILHVAPGRRLDLGDLGAVRDIYIRGDIDFLAQRQDWQFELNWLIMEMAIVRRTEDLTEVSHGEAKRKDPDRYQKLQTRARSLRHRMAAVSETNQQIPLFTAIYAGAVMLDRTMNGEAEDATTSLHVADDELALDLVDRTLTLLKQYDPMTFSTGLGLMLVVELVAMRRLSEKLRTRALLLLDQCPPREGLWEIAATKEALISCTT